MSSRVYCWQKYEDAKKAGLFEKYDYFWSYYPDQQDEPMIISFDHIIDVEQAFGSLDDIYIKPIDQEPAPNLELLERNE